MQSGGMVSANAPCRAACTKPLCAIQTLREKIAKSERKVLTLHIDRYADYATRTRLNKVKELFEKEGTKVVIKTR